MIWCCRPQHFVFVCLKLIVPELKFDLLTWTSCPAWPRPPCLTHEPPGWWRLQLQGGSAAWCSRSLVSPRSNPTLSEEALQRQNEGWRNTEKGRKHDDEQGHNTQTWSEPVAQRYSTYFWLHICSLSASYWHFWGSCHTQSCGSK